LNERQIEALRLMVNEGRELSNKDYIYFMIFRWPMTFGFVRIRMWTWR